MKIMAKWRILFTKTKKYNGINVGLSILFYYKNVTNHAF